MRENKLIKITENIKKDFGKLSEAKDLGEFVQILRDLGYTGDEKDLELDLFEILQNLSDEKLRIVSGGTQSIKNKIGAGILGGLTALSGVSSITATENDAIVTEFPIHNSDWNEDKKLDFETDPEELLLTENGSAATEEPDTELTQENDSGESSVLVLETDENNASTTPYSDSSQEFVDMEPIEKNSIEKENPKPYGAKKTPQTGAPLHKKINYGDLAGFLSLAASFVGGGLLDRYVLRKPRKPENHSNGNQNKITAYTTDIPELQYLIDTIDNYLDTLFKLSPDLTPEITEKVTSLVGMYIEAAILDARKITNDQTLQDDDYKRQGESIFQQFVDLVVTENEQTGWDQYLRQMYTTRTDKTGPDSSEEVSVRFEKEQRAINDVIVPASQDQSGRWISKYKLTARKPVRGKVLHSLTAPVLTAGCWTACEKVPVIAGLDQHVSKALDQIYKVLNDALDNLRKKNNGDETPIIGRVQ